MKDQGMSRMILEKYTSVSEVAHYMNSDQNSGMISRQYKTLWTNQA